MKISVKHILALGLLLLLPLQKNAKAQSNGDGPPPATPRVPRGIYALVSVEKALNTETTLLRQECRGGIPITDCREGLTIAGSNTYLSDLYTELLKNPAVSGLALQVHWDLLNPNPPGPEVSNAYFWDFVDDAFASVNAWNSSHPDAKVPKTIQLIVSAGFNSPQWVLLQPGLTPSCDGLFYDPPVPPGSTCGYATFTSSGEKGDTEGGDSPELPMPWNTSYNQAWTTFLQALAARYNDNPSLVSISVAGPTASSVEMIVPNGNNDNQLQFAPDGNPEISPNSMWDQLLMNAGFTETDQAFIDAWDKAIDTYGGIFKGLTLVATTGNGLPKLSATGSFAPPTEPIDFAPDCTGAENMDCQAESTILSYFVEPSVGGFNAKATQTSGLKKVSSGTGGYLGIIGVRYLSQQTAAPSTETTRILGGAQFDKSVAKSPEDEGSSPIVEQALYNVLQDFFTGTKVGSEYCVPKVQPDASGSAPLNYLQIFYEDFQYAASHPMAMVNECGVSTLTTAQQELNTASKQLLEISEPWQP